MAVSIVTGVSEVNGLLRGLLARGGREKVIVNRAAIKQCTFWIQSYPLVYKFNKYMCEK